jgi:hypothetical protein
MWTTDTYWFDVALVMSIFAVGTICFGRFEEHKSRGRRLVKVAVVLTSVLSLSAAGLRVVAWGLLALVGVAAAWIHLAWLPRHGINGWTGEPREKYLELVRRRSGAPEGS